MVSIPSIISHRFLNEPHGICFYHRCLFLFSLCRCCCLYRSLYSILICRLFYRIRGSFLCCRDCCWLSVIIIGCDCFGSVCLVGRYRRCSISTRKLLVFSIRTDKSFCFFSCISDLVPVLLYINDLAHLPITSISICLIYRSCFSAVFVRNICRFPFII